MWVFISGDTSECVLRRLGGRLTDVSVVALSPWAPRTELDMWPDRVPIDVGLEFPVCAVNNNPKCTIEVPAGTLGSIIICSDHFSERPTVLKKNDRSPCAEDDFPQVSDKQKVYKGEDWEK